jgi:hypothetical protein
LLGLGVAFVLPVLSSAAVQNVPRTKLAVGSGINQAIRQFGSVLGVALVIAVLGRAPETVDVFDRVFVLMMTAGLLVSLISLRIDTTAEQQMHESHDHLSLH